MSRRNWDSYFMDMAYQAATQATCPRRHVGSIIVKNRIIVSSGYNGAPSGVPDCYEVDCDLEETSYMTAEGQVMKTNCVRTVHSEQNAINFSSLIDRQGATIYVTDQPCWNCAKSIANSGIKQVVYHRPYLKDYDKVKKLFAKAGIRFDQITNIIPSYEPLKEIIKHEVVE